MPYVRSEPVPKAGILRRQSAYQFSKARKYEAYMLLTFLPYLQGMFLYMLAVSYPFFTVFLLIPGKANVLFTWMGLWAWIKSWDVGWALMVVADDVVWELMPKTAFIDPTKPAAFSSPISLFEAAFDGDYAYNSSTYWMLLSGLIIGIPMVTGQAVLGAKKAIAGTLLSGAQDFGGVIGDVGEIAAGGPQVRAFVEARESHSANEAARQSMISFASLSGDTSYLHSVMKEVPMAEFGAAADLVGQVRPTRRAALASQQALTSARSALASAESALKKSPNSQQAKDAVADAKTKRDEAKKVNKAAEKAYTKASFAASQKLRDMSIKT